ncbi:MAG: acyl-CoA dehydrogenase family protein [Alphaproteobacteria bacterium]|nr:acyl-CoA dehydrogenase family protein [Alphaproteobacteria bacterium]
MSVAMAAGARHDEVSSDEYIKRAEALLPLLRSHAAANEETRSIHPDVIAAMKQAGLFRILQPRRLGGAELDLRTMHRVIRTLATASPSASWVLMVLVAHSWILGMFDERVQDEIAAEDPETIIAGSLAPTGRAVRVDGGWRVSGRCPFASGTDHARWNLLGFKVPGEDSLLPAVHVLAPVRDYAVHDNWFTMGLRGTGSKELVLDDVFVPEHRAMPSPLLYGSLAPWGRRHPTWLHMMPVRPGLAYHVSAHVLGMAQKFHEEFVAITRVRNDKYTGTRKADSPGLQFRVAESEFDLHAAELILDRAADGFDTLAREHRLPTTEEFVDLRYSVAYAVQRCRAAVERLFAAAGANATYDSSPLQALFRDFTVATHHGTIDYDVNAEEFGRVRLGLPPTRPIT